MTEPEPPPKYSPRHRNQLHEIPARILQPMNLAIYDLWYGGEAGIDDLAKLYNCSPNHIARVIKALVDSSRIPPKPPKPDKPFVYSQRSRPNRVSGPHHRS